MVAQEKNPAEDKPIPGPSSVGPAYEFEPDWEKPVSPIFAFSRFMLDLVREPAHWIRKNVIEPNRGPKYYWYHRKFPHALPVDECYIDDQACIHEANMEFKRLYLVDKATLELLRYRRDSCHFWNVTRKSNCMISEDKCKDLMDTYDREEINFFIKYGESRFNASVLHHYNKQKHRMIVERRRAEKLAQLEAASAGPEGRPS